MTIVRSPILMRTRQMLNLIAKILDESRPIKCFSYHSDDGTA